MVVTDELPKIGRPSAYTEELALDICNRLAAGESLRAICAEEKYPDKSTVLRWALTNEAFRDQYTYARELQSDCFVDEIPDIADDSHNDWMEKHYGENTVWVENGEAIRRSQLRIDARKWTAGKMRPKKYGDKVTNVLSDPDGKPLNTAPTIIFTGCPPNTSPPEAVDSAPKRGD